MHKNDKIMRFNSFDPNMICSRTQRCETRLNLHIGPIRVEPLQPLQGLLADIALAAQDPLESRKAGKGW